MKKEEQKKIEEASLVEHKIVIVGEDDGTEDLRYSTLRQHQRRFIGDGFQNAELAHTQGYKNMDKSARIEQRKKHNLEMIKLKEDKAEEEEIVYQAVLQITGEKMRDTFFSLQKMGGQAVGQMFDRLFIENILRITDKIGVGLIGESGELEQRRTPKQH